jgi:hypothetical protein
MMELEIQIYYNKDRSAIPKIMGRKKKWRHRGCNCNFVSGSPQPMLKT